MYLDNKLVDDYLSAIYGHVYDDEEHVKNMTEETKENNQNSSGQEKSSLALEETRRIVSINPAAKFDNLYNYLIQNATREIYYEAIDGNDYNDLNRDDFVEFFGTMKMSRIRELTTMASEFSGLLDIFEQFSGKELAPNKTKQDIEKFESFNKVVDPNIIPYTLNFENNKYPAILHLDKEFLSKDLSNFNGNINLFGKIQRKIEKGKSVRIDDVLENYNKIAVNREQRKKLENAKMPEEIIDVVKGPAFLI